VDRLAAGTRNSHPEEIVGHRFVDLVAGVDTEGMAPFKKAHASSKNLKS
jgi:hypothetical protein